MNKKYKIFLCLALGGFAALASVLAGSNTDKFFNLHATDCPHNHVEHYDSSIDGTNGKVEHWACCQCHTAWADEARTLPIGNTFEERSKIDVSLDTRLYADYNVNNTKLIYNKNKGYSFKNYITNLDKDSFCAIETIDTPFTLDVSKHECVYALVTNKTSQIIRVETHQRGWGPSTFCEYLAPDETKGFFMMAEDWNNQIIDDNYGFALLCYNTAQQTAGGYIEVTKPEFGIFGSRDLMTSIKRSDFVNVSSCYSDSLGCGFASDLSTAGGILRITDCVPTDESLYDGVSFDIFNDTGSDITNRNIWSEGWDGHFTGTGLLKNGEWTTVFVSNFVWNYNPMVSIYDLPTSGYLFLTNFRLVEKEIEPEPTRIITFGEGGITLQSETVTAPTKWPSCSKTEINDEKVGLAYQYNASEFAGDVKGNQLYWVMNEQQVANVVAGFGSEMDIYVPDDGNTYQFAFQCGDTSTAWHETSRKALIGGQWNHVIIDKEWLSGLDFTGKGYVAYVRLYGGDFQNDDIKMTPIYKMTPVLTNFHFGQVTDTGEDDPIYGNIYNLIQGQWFIEHPDAGTMDAIAPGTLSALLTGGQTELVFKIYNPNAEAVNFHIAGGKPWTDGPSYVSLAPQAWTEVKLTAGDISATNITGDNHYIYIGSSDTVGWKITDIWAK